MGRGVKRLANDKGIGLRYLLAGHVQYGQVLSGKGQLTVLSPRALLRIEIAEGQWTDRAPGTARAISS